MATTESRVRACAKKKTNATCFFSGEVNANYALTLEAQNLGVFCCEKVVNQIRELNIPGLRIKGVSMAVFTEKEVELLEVRGLPQPLGARPSPHPLTPILCARTATPGPRQQEGARSVVGLL